MSNLRSLLKQLDESSDNEAEKLRLYSQLTDFIGEAESAPAIGIDLDGCIDEAPQWFRILSLFWPGKIYIITFRRDAEKAKHDVERFGLNYDEIILVNRFDAKAEVIQEKGISVYFDDQDEMLLHIPEHVTVLKIRNGGNYDFATRQWLFSNVTGRKI